MSSLREKGGPAAAPSAMLVMVGTLAVVYTVGQLLRNSIGVIAPNLAAELNLSASQIGLLSSAFFLSFAAVQLPLGIALDRYGPKLCMLVCAVFVIAGALLFATAESSLALIGARALMGIGTSCYLMAPLALYARIFPPERFAMLAGWQLGIGSIGTLLATAPLAFSAATIGWRGSFIALALIMIPLALSIRATVQEGPGGWAPTRKETLAQLVRGIVDAFGIDSVKLLFLINLANYSGFVLFVGLWGAPYLTHVYGYSLTERGNLLLIPAITQVAGMIVWGQADRAFGSYKIPVLLGAGSTFLIYVLLTVAGTLPPLLLTFVLGVLGFTTAFTPVVLAHGKSLFPPHLVGRGMTILNMGSMIGVFLAQFMSGVIIDLFPAQGDAYPLEAYRAVFAFEAALILVSSLGYTRAREPQRSDI